MKQLYPFFKPYQKQAIFGAFCKWMEALLELFMPTLMAYLINEGVLNHNQKLVIPLGIMMILMVICGFAFSIACQYRAAKVSQGFGTDVRNALFNKILHFSHEEINQFTTTALSNRLINDVNQLQLAVAMLIRLVVRAPFLVVGAFVMCVFLDVKLSLILLCVVPFIALILFVFMKLTAPMYIKYQTLLDRFSKVLKENLQGVRVIRSCVSQAKETKRFYCECNGLQKQMMRISYVSSLLNPLCALCINGVVVFALWNGYQFEHNIDVGVMVAFINYASQILLALVVVSNLVVIFTKAHASAIRVSEILSQSNTKVNSDIDELDFSKSAIVFDKVSFSYPNTLDYALKDISFTLEKGETLGIIGGTGSGKSTLINLLTYAYPCKNGTIFIFGVPINEIKKEKLYELFSLVEQKMELFSGTILENLLFANQNASIKEMEEVLEVASAKEFVEALKDGCHARVERGGVNFSGGQKQRLCIARGLLKKACILILDDCFSALDLKTDALVRKKLREYDASMTKVIVSQRIATLMDADHILVLDDGKMVGYGTHQELVNTCKMYREICSSQNIKVISYE